MADEARMRRLLDEAAAFAASDAFQSADGWDRLLELNEHALEAAPLETSYHGMIANQLAELLGTRAGMTGDPAHWRAAQSRVKDLLGTVPEDDWRFPLYVLADGAMHYRRAVASGNSEHIDPALTRLEGARRLVRRGSGISLTAAAYLSELYYRRYAVTRDRLDLESAISAGFAVGEGTPRPKERVLAMTILAGALGSRYELTHDPTDVEVAVAFAEDAVAEAEGREAIRAARGARATARRLRFRVRGDRNDLDDAIADYESVLTLTDDPIDRATSLDNQGNGLFDRYELDRRREDIEAAISASREAISLLPEADAGRARTLRNLGVALLACYRDTHDAGALGQAFDAFAQGLTVVSEDSDQYPLLLACLADAHLQRAAIDPDAEGSLDAALGLFDQAESLLGSRSQAPIPYALGASAIGGTVHAHVGALIWLANGQEDGERETTLRRALAVAEAAKTRELAGEIARIALAAPPEIPEGATWMEQYLLAELGRLDAQELARVGDYRPDELRLTRMAYRSRLLRQLDGVWDEIADVSDAAAAYVADRRGGTGQWDRALDVADPDTAYVSLSTAIDLPADVAASNPRPRKLVALAVRGGPAAPVVVIERRPDPTPDAVRRFGAEIPVDRGLGLFRESWDRDLVELLRELREGIGPVQRVAISPPANGRALPWALALERAGWCDPDGAALGVRTLPTLAVMRSDAPTLVGGTRWHAVRDAARSFGLDDPDGLGEAIGFVRPVPTGPAQGPPLVVGDPRADLPEAVREAVDVANILHVKPLLGPAATVGAVRTALAQASIVHLAAHARFTTTSPLDSPVLLADGELTARDLAGEFSANELIVMSACESGTGGRLVGDEVAGIAHVLLRAGARAVLASLWPVDDASTAALMTKFHSLRAAGADLATALATAAAAVRQHSQWQHPYYWAGFVLVEVS